MNIFVNGVKSKAGGGRSYLNNFLSLLKESGTNHRYMVLTPDKAQYDKYADARIQIIDIPSPLKHNACFLLLYHFVLPWLLRRHRIDAIFNLGDIVIPTSVPQLYLFDWPYAVYPDSVVWQKLDFAGYVTRKIKLFWFKRYLKYARTVVAQTATMRDRLMAVYGLDNIVIVPNAVSLENVRGGSEVDFHFPKDKFKLLCLSHYYSHKNIEIFIPIARIIKERSLPYCIITTLAPAQGAGAAAFLGEIRKYGLEKVILNIGPVAMANVPSAYAQSDAFLMPTLLETFSGTYVEAMFHRKAILTSNLDFAVDVCGDSAFYFDPLDCDSILDAIKLAFENVELRRDRIASAESRLKMMATWEQAFDRFRALLETESVGLAS